MIWPAKFYTFGVGSAYLVIVGFTLITDTYLNGLSLESIHKVSHIFVGLWALWIFMQPAPEKLFILFAFFNALVYGALAIFGFIRPDFLMLDAFNTADTALHSVVAVTGLVSGIMGLKKDES